MKVYILRIDPPLCDNQYLTRTNELSTDRGEAEEFVSKAIAQRVKEAWELSDQAIGRGRKLIILSSEKVS